MTGVMTGVMAGVMIRVVIRVRTGLAIEPKISLHTYPTLQTTPPEITCARPCAIQTIRTGTMASTLHARRPRAWRAIGPKVPSRAAIALWFQALLEFPALPTPLAVRTFPTCVCLTSGAVPSPVLATRARACGAVHVLTRAVLVAVSAPQVRFTLAARSVRVPSRVTFACAIAHPPI